MLHQTLMPLLYVGLGGFVGSVLRFLTTLATQTWSLTFPYGTLTSNLFGCFVIGALMGLATDTALLTPEMRLFLATGVCGGYTTLSSMIYELTQLLRDDALLLAAVYFAATFAGALLCFYAGSLVAMSLLRG